MIGRWVFDKLSATTSISAIVSTNIYPDTYEYNLIPGITYSVVSQTQKLNLRNCIVQVKSIQDTQDKCVTLNELVYSLFLSSSNTIRESSSSLKIESVNVNNHIPAIYDQTNQKWYGITDIRITYTY